MSVARFEGLPELLWMRGQAECAACGDMAYVQMIWGTWLLGALCQQHLVEFTAQCYCWGEEGRREERAGLDLIGGMRDNKQEGE